MKLTYRIAIPLFSLAFSAAQAVVLGQIDEFDLGPVQWQSGFGFGNIDSDPISGDRFMRVDANGGTRQFSKLTIFNVGQWTGNYVAAGVGAIEVDFVNLGTTPLAMRLAFKEVTGGGGYASTVPFALPADGLWRHAVFQLSPFAFTSVGAGQSFLANLADAAQLRIVSIEGGAPTTLNGDTIVASVGIDNIHAIVPEPSVAALLGGAVVFGLRGHQKNRARWPQHPK